MKRILSFCFLTLAIAFLAVSFGMSSKSVASGQMYGNAQDEIKKLEEERNGAIVHGDAAALDRLSSADYTVISEWGQVLTKAQMLDGFKSGAIKFESREESDLNIRVYGNSALVIGRVVEKGTQNGKSMSPQVRFSRVYVKEKGKWVAVSTQNTPIAM
jgi:ketosteroid isomerase-like protein